VTQHQLTEIVRRACQEITTAPVNARPKQLNYDSPRDVPKTQLDVEGHVSPEPARHRGRSTVGRMAQTVPASMTPGHVRWR